MADGSITIEGLDKVLEALAKAKPEVREAALKGVETDGMRTIATAQRNLKRNGSWVTGLLAGSGRVELVKRQGDETPAVDIGFFAKEGVRGYAEYVEYGRPPGKMPPPETLAAYFYKKFHLGDWKLARHMGWGAARNIAVHGTRPHPFFMPAVTLHKPRFVAAIASAIRKNMSL